MAVAYPVASMPFSAAVPQHPNLNTARMISPTVSRARAYGMTTPVAQRRLAMSPRRSEVTHVRAAHAAASSPPMPMQSAFSYQIGTTPLKTPRSNPSVATRSARMASPVHAAKVLNVVYAKPGEEINLGARTGAESELNTAAVSTSPMRSARFYQFGTASPRTTSSVDPLSRSCTSARSYRFGAVTPLKTSNVDPLSRSCTSAATRSARGTSPVLAVLNMGKTSPLKFSYVDPLSRSCTSATKSARVSSPVLSARVVEDPVRAHTSAALISADSAKTPRRGSTPVAKFDHSSQDKKDLEEKHEHLVFNWLSWAPEPDSICYEELHKNFPGALPGAAVNNRIRSLLQGEKYGFTEANTLLGYSLCPDEINYEPGCLVDLMKKEWGHMFPLGGISGAPFVGVTGFGAFSHHVPDDGNIIIIFGPHVAVSEEGLIGKTLRQGQNHLSTACGAVIGAYNACRKGSAVEEEDFNPVDMQMDWIKSELEEHIGLIQAQPNPMAALAYQAYEMVKAKLEKIVNLEFGNGKLVLIGGIQINMPHPYQEHFLPLSFEIRQKGRPSENLLPQFDCDFSDEMIDFARQWTPPVLRKRPSVVPSPVVTEGASELYKEFRNVQSAEFDRSPQAALDEKRGKQHAVFAWLSWSPEPASPCFKTLHREFPGALPGSGVHCRLKSVLTEEHGFTQANTLFGTSTCPDEINNKSHGLSALMASYWGSIFPLGGLAGVPFAGKTGFKAFSHHVPVNGDIIVLYGPHVGITACGQVGKHLREGQDEISTACGACIGAYNACCAEGGGDVEFDEVDIQMGFIKSQIAPHAKRIQMQPCPMAALAYQAFEAVKSKLNKVVNTEFGSGRLVLIGGIQINLPEPCGDHFLPLSCEVQQAGKPTFDIRDVFDIPGQEVIDGDFAEAFAGA